MVAIFYFVHVVFFQRSQALFMCDEASTGAA